MQIGSKIVLTVSAVMLVAGAVGFATLLEGGNQQRDEFRANSRETIRLFALAIAPEIAEHRHDRAQAMIDAMANFKERSSDIENIEVIGTDGKVIAASDPRRYNMPVDTRDIEAALLHGKWLEKSSGDELQIVVPLAVTHRHGVVRAKLSERDLNAYLASQRRWILSLMMLTIIAMGGAITYGHRRLVGNPLSNLARAAGLLGGGDMTVRAEVRGNDEISALSGSFNSMAQALQLYTEDLEQVIAERTSELEGANERLRELATTDQLTGLSNRHNFDEFARQAIELARRNGRPISLVLIDTDHFKSVNDRFGHPAGDQVLKDVAKTLQNNARKADMVARVGGEEFAVLMPDAVVELAGQAAERMRAALAAATHTEVPELGDERITASFGVACFDHPDGRLEDLYTAADEAMYRSKTDGRNRVTIADEVST